MLAICMLGYWLPLLTPHLKIFLMFPVVLPSDLVAGTYKYPLMKKRLLYLLF